MKIAVTGATGFAGRHVCDGARERGWDVLPLTRADIDFDGTGVLEALARLPVVDAVVHLASHVDLSPDASLSAFSGTNVIGTAGLVSRCRDWGALFVLASTIAVYGAVSPVATDRPPAPVNPYGTAKALAEQIALSSAADAAILRIGGVFGYGGPTHLGLNTAITAAVDRGDSPTLFGPGSGRRNYIYVCDLADAILTTIERRLTGCHLVAGSEALSIRRMLEAVAEAFCGAPLREEPGKDAADALVQSSPDLPVGRGFLAALEDIRLRHALPQQNVREQAGCFRP